MSTPETDRKARAIYGGLKIIAKATPTKYDDAAVTGLGSFRRGLRKLANWLRRRGYVLAIGALLAASGCRSLVRLDNWLPEWEPCEPVATAQEK